ncbi:zinc finger protein 595-like isoform X1 [Wyeomyia smithii]|uniref:zinc finger protein 595-like isoform X1 n=2 Tax=Wyeomyia smithii TaxID=174621 RepID=UPI002467B66D|nr:zinc finger protein 595-like isoform X1 [Wyeomyia smithii]
MEFHLLTDCSLLCRICMQDTTAIEAEDIYSPAKDEPSIYSLLAVVCAPVFSKEELQDRELLGMPKIVCLPCKQKIVAAYELHEACIEADRKLWDMISVQQELQDFQDISTDLEDKERTETPDATEFTCDDTSNQLLEQERQHKIREVLKIAKYKLEKSGASDRTCELCWKVTKHAKRLHDHMRKFHPNEIVPCPECNAAFFSSLQLEEHKLFHLTGHLYACPKCKKRFKSATGMRAHIRSHSSTARFQCDKCDKKCTNLSMLKTHLLSHGGERAYPCERCPSRFKTKGALKQHETVHSKERNYSCDICGSKFTKSNSLVRHVQIHSEERPYVCDVCPQRFKTSNVLKRHKFTHTGEKPFKCAYCDRAYAQSNDLAKHSRIHVGDKPYMCDRCDESFRLMTELRQHYKVHFDGNEQGENEAMNALNDVYSNENGLWNSLPFSVMSVLNRRFELEKRKQIKEQETVVKVEDDR